MMPNTIDVNISLISRLFDLTPSAAVKGDAPMFIGGDEESGEPDVLIAEEEPDDDRDATDTIRFAGDGTLTVLGDCLELSYDESALIGMEGCRTTLRFDKARGMVTMMRSGAASVTMIFSISEPRQHSMYDTGIPGFPLELCVNTRRLSDSVSLTGGSLEIDYVIELRGVPTERTVLRLEVVPKNEEATILFEHE